MTVSKGAGRNREMKRRTILILSGLALCVVLAVCTGYAVRTRNSGTPAAPKDTNSSLDMQEQGEVQMGSKEMDNIVDFEADESQKSGTASNLNDTGSTSGTDNADHASGMENTPGTGSADNNTGMDSASGTESKDNDTGTGSTSGSGTDGSENAGSKEETENPGNAGSVEKKNEWTEYYP